jgi:hypothetical protein
MACFAGWFEIRLRRSEPPITFAVDIANNETGPARNKSEALWW